MVKIVEEKPLLAVCAAGRIRMHRNDGTSFWLKESDLPETRTHYGTQYSYVGTEHGVGIYQEIDAR